MTHDYTCSPCTTTCPNSTWQSGECSPTGIEDYQCNACSSCLPGLEWEKEACSTEADTVCAGCAPTCFLGTTYESTACNVTAGQDRVCTPCTECQPGLTYSNQSQPCSEYEDHQCLTCSTCPDGKVPLGGCDGIEDTICGPPNDYIGSVSTGKAGASEDYPMGCTCDDLPVETKFRSIASWFFEFLDQNSSRVFMQPLVSEEPCVEDTCNITVPFSEPGGYSLGNKPTSVRITAEGCDGWCMSRVCLASAKLGKRYIWSGMQWMNPCGEGSDSEEPCSGLPWPEVPLLEENIGNCETGAMFGDMPASPSDGNASNTSSVGNTTDDLVNTLPSSDDVTAADSCTSCADRGNGFWVLGCGFCQDEDGGTPTRYYQNGMAAECGTICAAAADCTAYESEDGGDNKCYIYMEGAGSPGVDWTEEDGTDKSVSATSSSTGYTSGCNIRGQPSSCGGSTVVDSATDAVDTADDNTCVVDAVNGNFTTLGCGFCAAQSLGTPRRFIQDGMSVAGCLEACDMDSNCYAYEVGESGQQTCYMYNKVGNPGSSWTVENPSSTLEVATTTNHVGYPTGCQRKSSASVSMISAVASTPVSSPVADAVASATSVPTELPTAAPNDSPAPPCVAGTTQDGFTVVGCGQCESQGGDVPRRYFKADTNFTDCKSTCANNAECNAFESKDDGDKMCYVYFETGSPGVGWAAENENIIDSVESSGGVGLVSGCLRKVVSEAEERLLVLEDDVLQQM